MTRQAETAEAARRADADVRMLRAVRAAPGSTTYRIRVTARLNDTGARHALNRLEEAGQVRRDQRPGNSRTGYVSYWYPASTSPGEQHRREQLRAQNIGTLAGSVGQLVPPTEDQAAAARQLVARYAYDGDDRALLLDVLGL